MIATTLTALFVVVSFATLLALVDLWIRGSFSYKALKQERALMRAGFVPMIEAEELRLRPAQRTAPAASRPFARRVPSHVRAAA
ncbi:MAG: hypothetical protein AAFQ27_11835 [Pseudomonadota bacterium]